MAKIEIVEFEGGLYAARRTTRHFLFFKNIDYLRLGSGNIWSDPGSDWIDRCFSHNLDEVKTSLAKSGWGTGIPITKNMIVSLNECTKMNEMAEDDEGMKDTLLKAKEYYLLKKK